MAAMKGARRLVSAAAPLGWIAGCSDPPPWLLLLLSVDTLRTDRLGTRSSARGAPDGRRELPVNRDFVSMGGIPDYRLLDGQREVAFYRAGYDAEVGRMDTEVGRLLNAVAERGLLAETLGVFAADHGEDLTDPLVRVPLPIRLAGLAPRARDDMAALGYARGPRPDPTP
jgi:hypothetical protein